MKKVVIVLEKHKLRLHDIASKINLDIVLYCLNIQDNNR